MTTQQDDPAPQYTEFEARFMARPDLVAEIRANMTHPERAQRRRPRPRRDQ